MCKITQQVTTKKCPNCGNTHLVLLRTMDKKECLDCHTTIPWFLDKNQPPIR